MNSLRSALAAGLVAACGASAAAGAEKPLATIPVKVKTSPDAFPSKVETDGGITIETMDGRTFFVLDGRLQFDTQAYDGVWRCAVRAVG